MNQTSSLPVPDVIVYPESDGKPLADNTKQARWIMALYGNIAALFRDNPDVFVAADLLWYPVEGHPEVRIAPDVLIAFGRPKGDRGSYLQWRENNIPLTVVFEVLSPGNTVEEMDDKLAFYEEHGVEEYYVYNPDTGRLMAFVRRGDVLRRVRPVHNFVSPRLGIRFDLSGPEMVVSWPDGRPFLTFEEIEAAREQAQERAEQAERQATEAQQRAEQAERQAAEAQQRVARLAELSRKARRNQATAEELAELERLEKLASH
jgi:Uma2 family endonuclease